MEMILEPLKPDSKVRQFCFDTVPCMTVIYAQVPRKTICKQRCSVSPLHSVIDPVNFRGLRLVYESTRLTGCS